MAAVDTVFLVGKANDVVRVTDAKAYFEPWLAKGYRLMTSDELGDMKVPNNNHLYDFKVEETETMAEPVVVLIPKPPEVKTLAKKKKTIGA